MIIIEDKEPKKETWTLEKAKQDWINHKFPKVPEDDDYVPIPPAQINARPSGGEKKD